MHSLPRQKKPKNHDDNIDARSITQSLPNNNLTVINQKTIQMSEELQSRISSIWKPKRREEAISILKKGELRLFKSLGGRTKKRKYKAYHYKKISHQLKKFGSMRFLDYCFPLDSTYKLPDSDLKSDFHVFHSYEDIKRIIKIDIDRDSHIYSYEFEEKFPTRQIWKGIHCLDKLKSFLANLYDFDGLQLSA